MRDDWSTGRTVRTVIAGLLALVAAVAFAVGSDVQALQRCETIETEAPQTSIGDDSAPSADSDGDGVFTTKTCRPIEATALLPIALMIGLLLIPDISKLALGNLLDVEFREIKEAAETAKKEATSAKDEVVALRNTISVQQTTITTVEGLADVVRATAAIFARDPDQTVSEEQAIRAITGSDGHE